MTLTRRELFFFSAASLFVARGVRADTMSLDDALARIARARASLRTLEGPFTQVRKIGMLASEVKSTGTVTLVRPDRLRWELGPPDDVVYWVLPEGLAYKSKTGQGRVNAAGSRLAAGLDDLRTLLGGDLNALRARYDLRVVSADGSGVSLEATPKQGANGPRLQRIAFSLASDFVRPTRVTLVESARDKTEIAFGELHKDVPVDPAKMRGP